MRLTPTQFAIASMSGQKLPRGFKGELKERIRQSRDFLVKNIKADFGYEILEWHDYLVKNDEGYKFENKHLALFEDVLNATNERAWIVAVQELSQEAGRDAPSS
jgi:hypothetical protein